MFSKRDNPCTTSRGGNDSGEEVVIRGRVRSLSDPIEQRRGSSVLASVKVTAFLKKIGVPQTHASRKGYMLLPSKQLAPFSRDIQAAYSGPHGGLTADVTTQFGAVTTATVAADITNPHQAIGGGHRRSNIVEDAINVSDENSNSWGNDDERKAKWKLRNEKAYGMSVSLYEYSNRHTSECTGDPIADVFGIRTTSNSCVMAIADGVGWGHGARRAAQCAVNASMAHLWDALYVGERRKDFTTIDVFMHMRDAIDAAQESILEHLGSLTTICLAVVADTLTSDGGVSSEKALCVINIGDSLAFVHNQKNGVREVTEGCREYSTHRDMRFSDGALGPCMGDSPDLGNLTYSYTTVLVGDIVFLATDGVSDNFDPVICCKAVPHRDFKSPKSLAEEIFSDQQQSYSRAEEARRAPALSPRDRQEEMTRIMTSVIRENEIPNENRFCAASLCSKLLQYAVNLTENKRAAHEATNNIVELCRKENVENTVLHTGKEALSRHARSLQGKLDHATVVAYVVS